MLQTSHSLLIVIELGEIFYISYRAGKFIVEDGRFSSQVLRTLSQELISDSYFHSHKAVSVCEGRRSQNIYFLKSNFKFWKITKMMPYSMKFAKKKKAKIKITFQKWRVLFWTASHGWKVTNRHWGTCMLPSFHSIVLIS